MSELNERQAQPKRPRGRPKSADPLITVSTRLPAKHHDRLFEIAKKKNDPDISKMLRRIVFLYLRDTDPQP